VDRKLSLALLVSYRQFCTTCLPVALILTAGNMAYAQGKLYYPRDAYLAQRTTAEKSSAVPSSKSSGPWQVKYNLSGGIAGISRALMFNSDGQLIAVDTRNNIRKDLTASPEQSGEMRKLLDNLPTAAENVPKPARNCFDCLNSKITIDIDKKTYSTVLQNSGFGGEETPYQKLDSFLAKTLNQALDDPSKRKLP
jgi:hypothetical protein